MRAMASQITSLTMVYSTVYSGADKRKRRINGLCEGNSSGTGEFPAQRAGNAEMFPFNYVIMRKYIWNCRLQNGAYLVSASMSYVQFCYWI